MPPGRKRASAHVFTSEDAEHERADEAKYTTYYCKFCGQHVMTSTCDDLSALPRRRTDGALMLDLARHPTRILAALDAEVVAVRGRDGTYEKRQRARCGTTPVGYRDASRGANARADEKGVFYIHKGALSAFDYEKDHGASAGEGIGDDAPPPPCIIAGAGGATQIDLEISQRAATHAVTKISASCVFVDVIGPAHACDGELVEFLARVLGLRLAQMSLLRGHKQTSRTLLAKGTSPRAAHAALRSALEGERVRASKIAKGMT